MRNVTIKIFLLPALIFLISCAIIAPNPSESPTNRSIRIGTYNVENLFDGFDDPDKFDDPPPPADRLRALADVIIRSDCDVLALQEVENIEVLDYFNHVWLHDMYSETVLVEGNDPRGIDVAVLSKFNFETVNSYKNADIPNPVTSMNGKFSRDLIAVQWHSPDGMLWTLLTTHHKAGTTWMDRIRRHSQSEKIAEIIMDDGYLGRTGKGITILAGDLNSEPWSGDFQPIMDLPFSDPARDYPSRRTHASGKILDYVLLSPDAEERYIFGTCTIVREPPANKASDHFLVYVDLRF